MIPYEPICGKKRLNERSNAYSKFNAALQRGDFKRPKQCGQCGRKVRGFDVIVAHHDDHRYPLEIRWLCRQCDGLERWIASMGWQLPPEVWDAVRDKARREGINLRVLVLRLLQAWVNEA